MNNSHLKTVLGLLILMVLMSSCKDDRQDTEQIRPIKTITVQQTAIGKTRNFAGIVNSTEYSQLSFEVGGMVQSVPVDIGSFVEKGQELAVLDSEPYKLKVDAAKAELDKAKAKVVNTKAEYDRQQRVYEQGAGTQSRLDQAKYDYDAAQSSLAYNVSQLKLAERDLTKTSLKAPYEGYIAARYVEPHEEIQVGQRIFEINAKGAMEVILAISETNITKIHLGAAATVTFPTLPGNSIKGSITEIGSAAIKANSFPVKIALIDPPATINPGSTAEVSLIMHEKDQSTGILIPPQSFLPSGEKWQGYVFVYDPAASIVNKTPIRYGGIDNNMVIIEEGLAPGDIIAEAGVAFLADGMKVSLLEK
ncbi:MAG: efflux RND transporter periplasmic adaptor subunit [Planctomycetota bacterium]|jgi:RND family efflux transporter MFP subunit